MWPISSPAAKSLPEPDTLGKNWLRVRAAGKLKATVAFVTVRVFEFGSTERLPVEKSMLARGALRLAPVGSVAVELRLLWAKSTPMLVLSSLVPTGGWALEQALGVSSPLSLVSV